MSGHDNSSDGEDTAFEAGREEREALYPDDGFVLAVINTMKPPGRTLEWAGRSLVLSDIAIPPSNEWADYVVYDADGHAYSRSTLQNVVDEHDEGRINDKTQVVSYAGLDPAVNQSGEKDTTGGITKEGPSLLRWGVVQGALNAIRHDTYLGNYYTRLKETKPKKKALVATARKLLVMIYAMVTKEETYDPPGAPHS